MNEMKLANKILMLGAALILPITLTACFSTKPEAPKNTTESTTPVPTRQKEESQTPNMNVDDTSFKGAYYGTIQKIDGTSV